MRKIIVIVILILMFSCRAIYYKHNEQFETVERLLSRDSITFQELKELGFIDVENGYQFLDTNISEDEDYILSHIKKCYLQSYRIKNYGNAGTLKRDGSTITYFTILVESTKCNSMQDIQFLFYKKSNKIGRMRFYPSLL